MEENNKWLIIVLIILSIWFWRDHHNLKKQLAETQNELSYCKDSLDESENNLNQCSESLDQVNSNIEDAQSSAWSSYEDMGDAIDNLETVNP